MCVAFFSVIFLDNSKDVRVHESININKIILGFIRGRSDNELSLWP